MRANFDTADLYRPLVDYTNYALPKTRTGNRRQYDRYKFDMPVRIMTEDRREYEGRLVDISPGGLQAVCKEADKIFGRIVLYADTLGRFEGDVIRHDGEHFAIQMKIRDPKVKRLEKSITNYYENRLSGNKKEDRRTSQMERREHPRHIEDISGVSAQNEQGHEFICSIAELSLSGAKIITSAELSIGEKVTVGKVKGVITRKFSNGYAVTRL